jgi:hypothetical protein
LESIKKHEFIEGTKIAWQNVLPKKLKEQYQVDEA